MKLIENLQQFFLGKKEDPKEIEINSDPGSFAPPNTLDGDVAVAGGIQLGVGSIAGSEASNDKELIELYRSIARIPEVNEAVDEITNEMISEDADGNHVSLDMEELEISEAIKEKIRTEFIGVLDLLEFDQRGYEYVKRWYVDGRIGFHKVVDKKKLAEGIRELRYINPVSLEKVVEYNKVRDGKVDLYKVVKSYYRYTPGNKTNTINMRATSNGGTGSSASFAANGWQSSTMSLFGNNQVLAISPDAIAFCTSGQYDEDFGSVTSFLHPAIKPANNLTMMEDALVIYRTTRATERRIFYMDIGNLPKTKAEQYMRDMMAKFKTDLTYDSTTGALKDNRRFQSMMEDFWIPRRENGRSTEITTLPGGQNLGQLDDVEYFIKKLYKSLKVPYSRFGGDQPMIAGIGRSSEISRDEVRFQKFVDRLRAKFSMLFDDILGTQLVLKGIMKKSEWEDLKKKIQYKWAKDSFYTEMKETEMLRERLTTLQMAEPFIGSFFTKEYVLRDILQVSDEEFEELMKALDQEKKDQDAEEFDQAIQQNDVEADKLQKTLTIQNKLAPKDSK